MATIKELIAERKELPAYAFPGGYAIRYYDKSNNVLCPDCANELLQSDDDMEMGFGPVDGFIAYEGPSIECDNGCGTFLENAYGDPDGEVDDN